jgi:hypothetical protein
MQNTMFASNETALEVTADTIGFELYQDTDRVVIATLHSDNSKTGDMIQIWILAKAVKPSEALKNGLDYLICGDCKLRPHVTADGKTERPCYVDMRGPNSVYKAWGNGRYSVLAESDYPVVFNGRATRFGAYGDPIHIPLSMVAAIAAASDDRTGYTHQWTNPEYDGYKAFIMASVDNESEYQAAKSRGWRTFRCRTEDQPLIKGEIMCPASEEAGKRCQCIDCTLCDGQKNDGRADITIFVHGSRKKHFKSELISIGGAN